MTPEQPAPAPSMGWRLLKRLAIFIGVIALLVWVYRGNDDLPTSSSARTSPAVSADTVFLTTLETKGMKVTDSSRVIAGAHMVCSSLDTGSNPKQFALSFANSSGLGYDKAGYVMGAAVAAYCPEHRAKLGG